jgi:hypothetical protein
MPYSAELRLRAVRHSEEFLQKISSPTPLYATQREIQFKIFWSQLYAMRHSAESLHRAMPHSAESTHIREYLCKIETKFKNILG